MLIVVSIAAVGLLGVLALFVFLKDRTASNNRYLAFMLLATAVWILANMASVEVTSPEANEFFSRLITPASLLAMWSFFAFALIFPERRFFLLPQLEKLLLIPVIVIIPLAFSNINISAVGIGADGMIEYEFGVLYTPYLILLVLLASLGFYVLVSKYRAATALSKIQLGYVVIGLVLTVIPALLTGAILPAFGFEGIWNYSPLFSVFLFVFTTYAVMRHGLLDIRAYLIRSVAYIFALATIGGVYALVVRSVSSQFFDHSTTREEYLATTIFAIILVFTFTFVRRFFDKITTRLFYRDTYDSQHVLDLLSEQLNGETDLSSLSQDSVDLLTDVLKLDSAQLIVFNQSKKIHTAKTGRKQLALSNQEMSRLRELKSNITVTNQLKTQDKNYTFLSGKGIGLVANLETQEGSTGLLVLGRKRNGSSYYTRDVDFLEIANRNIALAINNAKKYEEVASFNTTLKQRIKEATNRLQDANKQLQELDSAKDDFISMASHQLRPQLTAAKGFVSMLDEEIEGEINQGQRELLGLTIDSVDRMTAIVRDMLDLSHFESGDIHLATEAVELAELVESEVNDLLPKAAQQDIAIELVADAAVPELSLDKLKIREVVSNLISNAIQYSPENSTIIVTLDTAAKHARVTVADQGFGVPKAAHAKIFEKFYRAGNAKKVRPTGTGLGLYLSKQIIEAHGGTMIFKSSKQGSTFGFTIPLKK